MKKTILLTVLLAVLTSVTFSQVAINETGADPDPSAILDLSSSDKGFLVPRVSTVERNAIATTQSGLLVYDTDTESFWYYNNMLADWVEMSGGGADSDWIVIGDNMYSTVSGNVGIGTDQPDHALEIVGNHWDDIVKISDGNYYGNAIYFSNGAQWASIGGGSTGERNDIVIEHESGEIGIGRPNPAAKLDVDGSIRMTDGNEGVGKVMVSDAIGKGSWQTIPAGAQEINDLSDGSFNGESLFLGLEAGINNSANFNTAVGKASLKENLNGGFNTALGNSSLISNESGNLNTVIGYSALSNNISGGSNTVIGAGAGMYATGDSNIFIGYLAGQYEYGNNKLYIDNSNTSEPLIGGDFAANTVDINGSVKIAGGSPEVNKVLVSTDADGNAVWEDISSIGGGIYNDWTISGDNMYSAVSGNVGIGTTNPNTKLQIRNGNLSLISQNEDAYIKLSSDEEEDITPAYIWSENAKGFSVGRIHGTPQFLVNAYSGNVGIGTSTPEAKLEVVGQVKITGGTPDAGRVLTSLDNEGNAQWLDLPSSFGSITDLSDAYYDGTSLFLGYEAGINTGLNKFNTAVGKEALKANTTGQDNTAMGFQSLINNVNGNKNTAFGLNTLRQNVSGSNNVALGYEASYKNTSGYSNVAIGTQSLYWGQSINNTVAVGDSALYWNGFGASDPNDGIDNTAIGSKALLANTTGYRNTAVGKQALEDNGSGKYNTAIGYNTMNQNISGDFNTVIGTSALTQNQGGEKNVAIGSGSLFSNISGSGNVAIGTNAGLSSTGFGNVFIGNEAGYNVTGSDKLFIDNSSTNQPLIYGEFDDDYLEINGELNVKEDITVTGDYKFQAPKTCVLKIGANKFVTDDENSYLRSLRSEDGYLILYGHETEPDNAKYYASVNLPYGATITRFSLFADKSVGGNIIVTLNEREELTLGSTEMARVELVEDEVQLNRFDAPSITNPTINNDKWYTIMAFFFNEVYPCHNAISGVEIVYTIDKVTH